MTDNINHPKHYNTGKIEVIEFIEDQGLNFNLGNVTKYIARAGKKDSTKVIEDLEKARWYLSREIELRKSKTESREPVRPNEMVLPGIKGIYRESKSSPPLYHSPVIPGPAETPEWREF